LSTKTRIGYTIIIRNIYQKNFKSFARQFFDTNWFFLVLFAIFSFLFFWPVIRNLGGTILGNASSANNAQDGYQNIWNFWWAKKTCLGFCGNLWQTDYMFFPGGTSLLFQTFAYPSLVILYPFLLLGLVPVAAYNISMILAVFLSMVCMYFLILYLTRNKRASFLIGLSFGLSPYLIGHILDGQLNLSNIFYFPLLIFLTLKTINSKKWYFPAISGIVLFAAGANDFIYLIFSMVIIGSIYSYILITKRGDRLSIFKKGLITLIVFLIPFVIFFHNNFSEYKNFNLKGVSVWNSDFSSVDLGALFSPPPHTIIGTEVTKTDYFKFTSIYSDKSVYYSIVILLLAFIGLKRFKLKEKFFWVIAAFVPFVFSFGPKLKLNKEIILSWMPYQILEKIPIINILRNPSRLNIFSLLIISILAGYGYLELEKMIKNKRITSGVLFGSLFIILLLEIYPVRVPTTSLSVPEGYKRIKDEPGDFAIFEFPILWMSGLENRGFYIMDYLYYQTYHEKKMNSGYVTRMRDSDFGAYKDNSFLNFSIIYKQKMLSGELSSYLKSNKSINVPEKSEYRYIIFHKELYQQPFYDPMIADLKKVLGSSIKEYYKDEQIEIYKIEKK
jgi:hypothetical protein